jgi:hypothetical protein
MTWPPARQKQTLKEFYSSYMPSRSQPFNLFRRFNNSAKGDEINRG